MKQLSIRILFLAILVMAGANASAYDCQIDGIYYSLSGNEATVARYPNYNYYTGNINIPSSITYNGNNYRVTSIASYAFAGCSKLNSVIIPNSITTIGDHAFYNGGLTTITIPNSVYNIGAFAFESTPWLKNQPEGLVYAGKVALLYKGIISVYANKQVIKEGTIGIASGAYYNKRTMMRISIPKSLKFIGGNAFEGCTDLKEIYISDLFAWCNVAYGGNPSFKNHDIYLNENKISNLIIPEEITTIGDYAFYNCNNISSVTFNDNIKSIGIRAFTNCTSINHVKLPSGLQTIGEYAFAECSCMETISIDNGLTKIERGILKGCSSLKRVYIPKSVTCIGNYAFQDCNNLLFVAVSGYPVPDTNRITLSDNVTSIEENAFNGCKSIEEIAIGNGLKYVGINVFGGCNSLKRVYIPNLLVWCSINFESNPLSLAHHIFLKDSFELINITIPEGVDSIRDNAFSGGSALKSINLPNSIRHIGKGAFAGCTSITTFTIPSNVKTIDNYAFGECSALTSITIPNTLENIGSFVFNGCSGLSSVTLKCKEVKDWFNGLTSIKDITLGEEVQTISENAFKNCTGLSSVIVPDNIIFIGNQAFPQNTTLLSKKGTKSLLSLWNAGITPIWIQTWQDTNEKLMAPSLEMEKSTQTTMTIKINNMDNGYNYKIDSQPINSNTITITGLRPEYNYSYNLSVSLNDVSYLSWSNWFKTSNIGLNIIEKEITASSLSVEGHYLDGDAVIVKDYINNEQNEGASAKFTGLDQNSIYNIYYYVIVKTGEGDVTYSCKSIIETKKLTITTQQPKVISSGNVIVAAETNLDDAETNVGFEWRRTDWGDDFQSNSGTAYLYEGQMEGYIRNLNTEKLWKYRPYYESASGNRYYGEWVGIDPTNTSYFEPTVHTYASVNVQGNSAMVQGYAQQGTDNINSRGFKYWTTAASARSNAASVVPKHALTVEATGTRMEAELTGLDYATEYSYVAFVTTSEGETFYGDVRQFTTGTDPSGISPTLSEAAEAVPTAYYDLRGRRYNNPQRGLNIVRMSDGTTRKMMIK